MVFKHHYIPGRKSSSAVTNRVKEMRSQNFFEISENILSSREKK